MRYDNPPACEEVQKPNLKPPERHPQFPDGFFQNVRIRPVEVRPLLFQKPQP